MSYRMNEVVNVHGLGCGCPRCRAKNLGSLWHEIESTVRNDVLKPAETVVASGVATAITGTPTVISYQGSTQNGPGIAMQGQGGTVLTAPVGGQVQPGSAGQIYQTPAQAVTGGNAGTAYYDSARDSYGFRD